MKKSESRTFGECGGCGIVERRFGVAYGSNDHND